MVIKFLFWIFRKIYIKNVLISAPLCPIFVIGTHIDEVTKYEAPKLLKKRYTQIVDFFFISSYDGTGIEELSKAIIEVALKEKYMVNINAIFFCIISNFNV